MDRGRSFTSALVPPRLIRLLTLAIALAVIAIVLAIPGSARACTFPVRPLEEYSEEVAVAFVGRQIDWRERGEHAVLTFAVHRVYKGEVGPRIRFDVAGRESPCSDLLPSGTAAVVAGLVEEDRRWHQAGDLYVMLQSAFVSEADLIEVFGAGYPPDPKIQPPEPQTSELQTSERSDNATPLRHTVASGIALVVLGAVLVATRRRRGRDGRQSGLP